MDLDSRASSLSHNNTNFKKYQRILEALRLLDSQYDYETPEMWCSRICDPFKKILKENLGILFGNGYITMYGKYIDSSDRVYSLPFNYIYCNICDFLVFIPETPRLETSYQDSHFKRCINGDIILNEHARRKEIFQSIDERESTIRLYKQHRKIF
ncbi:hypothetical protein RhiirB3_457032 [Rhizophagus irregularis]|nr:hypothetical protein RhiirB3_457032 [Rhizophagus irregularis]